MLFGTQCCYPSNAGGAWIRHEGRERGLRCSRNQSKWTITIIKWNAETRHDTVMLMHFLTAGIRRPPGDNWACRISGSSRCEGRKSKYLTTPLIVWTKCFTGFTVFNETIIVNSICQCVFAGQTRGAWTRRECFTGRRSWQDKHLSSI